MKCMASVDKKHIKRVTDEEASQLYEEGWNYVSKSLWKEKVRDVEPTTEQLEIEVRSQRNMLLQQSDWTQSRDVTLSNDADWKTYRQSLRDIPSQSGFPKKITWPTAP